MLGKNGTSARMKLISRCCSRATVRKLYIVHGIALSATNRKRGDSLSLSLSLSLSPFFSFFFSFPAWIISNRATWSLVVRTNVKSRMRAERANGCFAVEIERDSASCPLPLAREKEADNRRGEGDDVSNYFRERDSPRC